MNDQANIVRRYLGCAAFVLLWMACGFYFHLSPIAYPLLGLPLIAGFQLAIARRPLAQLWARDAEQFRVDGQTLALAVGLLAMCVALLVLGRGRLAMSKDAPWALVLLAAAAIPAAFALRHQRAEKLRFALPIIAIAIVIRLGWRIAWAPTWDGSVMFPLAKLPDFFAEGLYEFVGLFLVDEVAFRGALDPHLEAAGAGRLHAWNSAVFVSILGRVASAGLPPNRKNVSAALPGHRPA